MSRLAFFCRAFAAERPRREWIRSFVRSFVTLIDSIPTIYDIVLAKEWFSGTVRFWKPVGKIMRWDHLVLRTDEACVNGGRARKPVNHNKSAQTRQSQQKCEGLRLGVSPRSSEYTVL
jgi:hypothetical protein